MKRKVIMKIIVFILVGYLLFWSTTKIMIPKWTTPKDNRMTYIIKGFYKEPKNSLDVIFMGNSDVYRGISPIALWDEYGIASYNFVSSGQRMWTAYYMMEECFRYQKPNLIVLNMDSAFNETSSSESNYRKTFDNMKMSKNKLKAITDSSFKNKKTEMLSYILPLTRYHSRWNELDSKDIKEAYEVYDAQFKGYELTRGKKAYKKTANKQENDDIEKIPQKSKEYLDKIIKLCNENNTQVLLTYIPTKNWTEKRNSLVTEYAKENNIQFTDCNLMKFDWNQYTRDKGSHLNVYGAEAITKQLSEYLKGYNLPNHKEDTKYEKWNKDLEKYEEQKNA